VELLQTSGATTLRQLISILGPVALLAMLLAGIEHMLTHRLISRFGWRGVLFTGWLGVPVHELSHVVACMLFGHKVEHVRLFAPDPRTGRLGSVQHAWKRRNIYQQAGRFFIGTAPLVGGALMLWALTWLIGPIKLDPAPLPPGADVFQIIESGGHQAVALISNLVRPEVLKSGWTWLWLYLCLCIGAHIAPSMTDLKGGVPGFVLLVIALFVVNMIVTSTGNASTSGEAWALEASSQLLALLTLALALGVISLGLVTLATALLPVRKPVN
jgi:hypothetical protein